MARTVIDVDGEPRTVDLDARARRGSIRQSILMAQLVDELSDLPVTGRVRVASPLADGATGVRPKAGPFGVCGLVGEPIRVFPRLGAQAYDIDVVFSAEGFVPLAVQRTLAVQPGFPDVFSGVELGVVRLRRLPARVVVRTTELLAGDVVAAVPNAVVAVSGMWKTFASLSGAAVAPDLIAVTPGLSASRPVGAVVQPVTITPVGGPQRTLLDAAPAGASSVVVSRGGGIVVGDVIGLDPATAERAEFLEITSISGCSDPESPVVVGLRFALRHDHASGATATRVTVASVGPPTAQLTDAAEPGDVTLFVDAPAPFATPRPVQIVGGSAAPEYRGAQAYTIATDAAGYGRFPLLGRVAALEVSAQAGARAAGPRRCTPDRGAAETAVPLTMT